jgi:hypothetical protein
MVTPSRIPESKKLSLKCEMQTEGQSVEAPEIPRGDQQKAKARV